jgi:hypothetical protein
VVALPEVDVLLASQVVLAIEIISPGSARTDRIAKLADYAKRPRELRRRSGSPRVAISLTLDLDTLVVR